MKKSLIILLLTALLALTLPASAYELNGTVISAMTLNITADYAGSIDTVLVRPGQSVQAGQVIATLRTTKVYASESGKVYLFGSIGDNAESVAATYGAVAYLEPDLAYSVTGNTKYAYDSEANKIIHPGESVMLRTTDGESSGRGLITSVTDSSFEVLVTNNGDLLSGDSANIFRAGNYQATNRIGRGTVTRRGPLACEATGIIVSYAVTSGQKVEKGDLLFETLTGPYQGGTENLTQIKAPTEGVIYALSVNPGSTVSEGAEIAQMYPLNALRVEATAQESDLVSIHVGDPVQVELIYLGNGDKILNGQVEYISNLGAASETEDSEVANFPVYVTLNSPDLNVIAYGMNAIVTNINQTVIDFAFEEDPAAAQPVPEPEGAE